MTEIIRASHLEDGQDYWSITSQEIQLETIASRSEAIASRLEAIASRLEAIAIRYNLSTTPFRLSTDLTVQDKSSYLHPVNRLDRQTSGGWVSLLSR